MRRAINFVAGACRSRSDALSCRRLRKRHRTAAAVVEFAVIAPVLIILILGIIEFGRMIMMQQIITNASREGARRAIVEGATESEVQQVVDGYLTKTGISDGSVTVTPANLNTLGLGDPVNVRVTAPYDANSWLPSPWFLAGKTLTAESVMRAERPQ